MPTGGRARKQPAGPLNSKILYYYLLELVGQTGQYGNNMHLLDELVGKVFKTPHSPVTNGPVCRAVLTDVSILRKRLHVLKSNSTRHTIHAVKRNVQPEKEIRVNNY